MARLPGVLAHILRDAVRLMLHKHKHVQVINARGNHGLTQP